MESTQGMTRRRFLAGATGTAAALAGLGPGVLAAATRSHTVKVGTAEVTVFSDGIFTMPLSFVLPDTPKADAEAYLKAHASKLEFVGETNVILIRSGKTVALVDTGGGTDFMPGLGKLPDALEGAGVSADSVGHVLYTHAHADHFWGTIDPFTEASRWPNARHVMGRRERDFWQADGSENKVPDAVKGMAIGIKRRLTALGDTITVAADEAEVAPGIALMATPGHTPGHCSVVVRSGTDELIIGGDALTHAAVSFGEPGWHWGSDTDRQQAVATRLRLLDRLAASKAMLAGYHFPWPGIGRVEKAGSAYRFVPLA